MSGPAWVEGGGASSTTVPLTNVSANYAADNEDCVINCTDGTFTVTLPTAVGVEGQYYIVKNSGLGVITLACSALQTIDNSATKILAVRYESLTVVSDGVNWLVV